MRPELDSLYSCSLDSYQEGPTDHSMCGLMCRLGIFIWMPEGYWKACGSLCRQASSQYKYTLWCSPAQLNADHAYD